MSRTVEVDAVKLEGGARVVPHVEALIDAGVAVCGHIGLTPQSYSALGGYRVQGRTAEHAYKLVEEAKALEAKLTDLSSTVNDLRRYLDERNRGGGTYDES